MQMHNKCNASAFHVHCSVTFLHENVIFEQGDFSGKNARKWRFCNAELAIFTRFYASALQMHYTCNANLMH